MVLWTKTHPPGTLTSFSSFCTCLRLLPVGFKVIMLFFLLLFHVYMSSYSSQWCKYCRILENFSFSNIPGHNQFSSMTLRPCVQPGPLSTLSCLNINSFWGGALLVSFWSSDFSQGLKNPSRKISLNSCPEICWISYTNWFTSTSLNHSFT